MSIKNKYFLAALFLLLFAPYANADVILPHFAMIQVYLVFIFAIPVIFVETFYFKRAYKNISVWFWLISTIVINAVSAFAGFFIGLFSSFIIPNFIQYSHNFYIILAHYIVCFILSWLIEYVALLPIVTIFEKQVDKLFKNVFFANLYSYIVIFVLHFLIFYLPHGFKQWF